MGAVEDCLMQFTGQERQQVIGAIKEYAVYLGKFKEVGYMLNVFMHLRVNH